MRARGLGARAALLVSAMLVAGCYVSTSPDASADGDADGGVSDGAVHLDAAPADSNVHVDGGMCESFGTTRECGPACGLPCPSGWLCNGFNDFYWGLCQHFRDDCAVSLAGGWRYDCHGGRVCVTTDRWRSDDSTWGGMCVDPEYCRWLLANPDARPDLRCRYSEGTLFESGPPDHACAPGAYEFDPFCGGACGDACPEYSGYGGCVGISETRGFGVCVPYSPGGRCWPPFAFGINRPLEQCAWELVGAAGAAMVDPDPRSVCMLLSPTAISEYADHGWAVSQQSCLAYRARYPEEVRCFDQNWNEL